MSNESNRIGFRTGGNANLLSILGDLLSSDGIQALRVPLGSPGQFLGVDLTAECGMSWQDTGGGAGLTFSDGLTKTVSNVTNDLVTGVQVAAVDIDSASTVSISSVGQTNIDADGTLFLTGQGLSIASNVGTQLILSSGANTHIDAGGNIQCEAGGNFTFTADAGSNGSFIVRPDGIGVFAVFDGVGLSQHVPIADAAGGTVEDSEARTAINALLGAMRAWGFVDT